MTMTMINSVATRQFVIRFGVQRQITRVPFYLYRLAAVQSSVAPICICVSSSNDRVIAEETQCVMNMQRAVKYDVIIGDTFCCIVSAGDNVLIRFYLLCVCVCPRCYCN